MVLANVPSFWFSFRGNMRTYPRSGFRSGKTSECTLVPVFVLGEHPPKPPFWKATLLSTPKKLSKSPNRSPQQIPRKLSKALKVSKPLRPSCGTPTIEPHNPCTTPTKTILSVNECSLLNPSFETLGSGNRVMHRDMFADRQVRICLTLAHALYVHAPSQAI